MDCANVRRPKAMSDGSFFFVSRGRERVYEVVTGGVCKRELPGRAGRCEEVRGKVDVSSNAKFRSRPRRGGTSAHIGETSTQWQL